MLAYKIPLTISAAVLGAYAMPLSTNQMLLVAQAVFGICVCFALFMLVLYRGHVAGKATTRRRARGRRQHAGGAR